MTRRGGHFPTTLIILASLCFVHPSSAAECKNVTYQDLLYTICSVTADEDLRLWHLDVDQQVYGGFAKVEAGLDGRVLGFAMNAGMYHSDRRPVGLYIENGVETGTLSDGGGYGNFGLLPNGVFCIGDGLRVWESAEYSSKAPDCRYATQSGPMLVIDGRIHPRFLPDGTSRYVRNGVGTSLDGKRAVFVISNHPVTFYEFALLFRDHLDLPNALFLDGNVSRLHAPGLDRSDGGFAMGPILGVVD